MLLHNFPEYRSEKFYHNVIDKVTEILKKQKGIVSVYQIGGINDLGISDLDIVAVFRDGIKNEINPVDQLSQKEKYLFTHSVFGIHKKRFHENQKYSLFHNYKLLWGDNLDLVSNETHAEIDALKKQIALEFLFMNLLARTVEKRYGALSVHNILLSVKAIEYDLKFLNISHDNPLYTEVKKVLNWRKNWFSKEVTNIEISDWFYRFYSSLCNFHEHFYSNDSLIFPSISDFRFSRNIYVGNGTEFSISMKGMSLPPSIIGISKKIRNFNRLFNRFEFEIPMAKCQDSFLRERFKFYQNLNSENKELLPYYAPLSNPFIQNLFR